MITSRDDANDCSALRLSSESSIDESLPLNDMTSSEQPMDTTSTDDNSSQTTTADNNNSPETTVVGTDVETSFCLSLPSGDTLTVSLDTHCEYESRCLPEFFDGLQKGKSAESYVQIRNHFIKHWTYVRPKRFGYHEMLRKVGHLHLGKGQRSTQVTSNLCLGNVTAFSRVQKFLESHRVINEGSKKRCDLQKGFRHKNGVKRVVKEKRSYSENQIKKLSTTDDTTAVKLSSRTRPNPFKLVPLQTFDDETQVH